MRLGVKHRHSAHLGLYLSVVISVINDPWQGVTRDNTLSVILSPRFVRSERFSSENIKGRFASKAVNNMTRRLIKLNIVLWVCNEWFHLIYSLQTAHLRQFVKSFDVSNSTHKFNFSSHA